MIFVHELGHFIAAKRFGVLVHEFAIGMGPKIFSKKGKETDKIDYQKISDIILQISTTSLYSPKTILSKLNVINDKMYCFRERKINNE